MTMIKAVIGSACCVLLAAPALAHDARSDPNSGIGETYRYSEPGYDGLDAAIRALRDHNGLCQIAVELGTSAVSLAVARARGWEEIGKALAMAVGDKAGGKYIAPLICTAPKPDGVSYVAPAQPQPSPNAQQPLPSLFEPTPYQIPGGAQ
jgi:hypothetical protein